MNPAPAESIPAATTAGGLAELLSKAAVATTNCAVGSYSVKKTTGHSVFNIGAGEESERSGMHPQLAAGAQGAVVRGTLDSNEDSARAVYTLVHNLQYAGVPAAVEPSQHTA